MTSEHPLVSAVIVFFNEERFLADAVASVYAQTHPHWELILADDGSTDSSPQIAREFARRDPDRVLYVEHAGHANRGVSATRNLGVQASAGEWVAFLDGDDVWLPQRLERGLALASAHPVADMLYGRTQYWSSWDDTSTQDRIQSHFFRADRLLPPPELLIRHLTLHAAFPCMGSLLVRRRAILDVGGFEESFRDLCEDAVFLGKICLEHHVYVSSECWDRYRQRHGSMTSVANAAGRIDEANLTYLRWLEAYIASRGRTERKLERALSGALRRTEIGSRAWENRVGRTVRRIARWAMHH